MGRKRIQFKRLYSELYLDLGISQVALVIKNSSANAGNIRYMDLIPASGRSLGEGHENPLQYSCLENRHGQRSLVGYSPQGHKELDKTKETQQAYTPYVKQIASGKLLYDTGSSAQCSVTTQRGRMGSGVRERFKREGTYVYLWLIYISGPQKPTQHCKGIIFQLKINLKNNNSCL